MLSVAQVFAQAPSPPSIRIGVVGDPVHRVAWTADALRKLKAIGFNEVQLNLAWGSHPTGDPMTLIDVVSAPGGVELPGTAERRAELKRRVTLAKQQGLRMLFHTGSPYMGRNPYTGAVSRTPYRIDDVTYNSWYDILNPAVVEHERELVLQLRKQFPEVEDLLVYTYDVEAWQTPEFQYTRFSYGVPLSERLPGYLAELHKAWTEGRTGQARFWWEPWELSAGEVYAILPKLPPTDFGLIVHSNSGEVQLAAPVDVWLRNTARMCRDLGIPVVVQGFFSSATEEIEPLSIPAPRLVDEEMLAVLNVPGVTGIKEYYGVNTSARDIDMDLLTARLRDLSRPTDTVIAEITRRFGAAQPDVLKYLSLIADALQTYPWDASWLAREVGRASTDHGWRAATIQGMKPPTPAWESTRYARFMQHDLSQPHFWMLEDVELRCKLSAEILDRAADVFGRLITRLPNQADKTQFEAIQRDVDSFRRVARSYALHLRETNVAQMLRQDLAAGRPLTPTLAKELAQLLDADVVNQDGHGRVVEFRRLYLEDPEAFVRRYLVPVDVSPNKERFSSDLPPVDIATPERGDFTLTTR